jgi:endonuclease YncB( thermonuclease family)
MAVPYYKAIKGKFVIIGKEPDGDSVRFIADDPQLFTDLYRSYRIKPSRTDGSVQLRFEAIDAPETHYGKYAQPMGDLARNAVVQNLGFTDVTYGGKSGNLVTASEPASIPGIILTKGVDANGRPISYVLSGDNLIQMSESRWHYVGKNILEKTLNWAVLAQGHAYLTVYTSTPALHRRLLRKAALSAREENIGVWSTDDTSLFTLENYESIGPEGNLILPKLFRRCIDYLKALEGGFSGELTDWLRANNSGTRMENDQVLIDGILGPVPLSSLLAQYNNRIALETDLLNITFLEK